MPGEKVKLAVLFVDIARSTHIYETLGDQTAQSLVNECLHKIVGVVDRQHGKVIKHIGDGLMCAFSNPADAVEAAMEMQSTIDQCEGSASRNPINPNIHVGIHFGDVVRDKGDLFGDAVNVAARVTDMAEERQILTTRETFDALPPDYNDVLLFRETTTVKGRTGEIDLYEVVWEQLDVTMRMNDTDLVKIFKTRLELWFGKQKYFVDVDHPMLTIGRSKFNDIVLGDDIISRTHCHIEFRRNRFAIIDNSSNGTYLHMQGKPEMFLHKEEGWLEGRGVISLGQKYTEDPSLAIRFKILV